MKSPCNGLAITEELTEQLKGYIDEIDFSTMHMFGTPEKEQQLIQKHGRLFEKIKSSSLSLIYRYELKNELKGEINYESIGSKKYKKILWKGA